MMSRLARILDRAPIEVLLIAITLAAYWRIPNCKYVYDDFQYIWCNPHVRHGLSIPEVKWAFTSNFASNWHPLTWISYMVDTQLTGVKAATFHVTNLLLHLVSTLILFVVLSRATKSVWRGAFVAALFAVHPLHVESVAWISERKDVLSGLFWMLTTWAYIRYVEKPGLKRYLLIALFLTLGLMSKAMLVTLPFTLLLLDYWPLRRMRFGNAPGDESGIKWSKLVVEKLPLFALAVASGIVTYVVQITGGARGDLSQYPSLTIRVMNALVSYAAYMRMMIYPRGLAPLYPHLGKNLPAWQAIAAFVLLALITSAVIRLRRSRPYLIVGWLWYLVTLAPVIGIIQVGTQAYADRYTYIPLIGLFIMIAWGVPDLIRSRRLDSENTEAAFRPYLSALALVVVMGLAVLTRIQVRCWLTPEALFRHTIAVTKNNVGAHINLGFAYQDLNRFEDALAEYQTASEIDPSFAPAHYNAGNALYVMGRNDEAIVEFKEAIRLYPDYTAAHCTLGTIYQKQGKIQEACDEYAKSLAISPRFADANNNMGTLLDEQGQTEEALTYYQKSVAINPDYREGHFNAGTALFRMGRYDGAAVEYGEAIRCDPTYGPSHKNMAAALFRLGDYAGAWNEVHLAMEYGSQPHPAFLAALSSKMPEPEQ